VTYFVVHVGTVSLCGGVQSTQLLYKFPYHSKSPFIIPTSPLQKPTCQNSQKIQTIVVPKKNYLKKFKIKLNLIFNNNDVNLDPKFKLNSYNTKRPKRAIDFIRDPLSWCCNTATMTNLKDLSKKRGKSGRQIEQSLRLC
jgi:hypothetical protein